jgi:hypothetical protein
VVLFGRTWIVERELLHVLDTAATLADLDPSRRLLHTVYRSQFDKPYRVDQIDDQATNSRTPDSSGSIQHQLSWRTKD